MKLLAAYLADYWRLVAVALVLAAVNQIFSLLDPLIFRHVIDQYATRFSEYTTGEFFRGVSLLLAAAVGVAFVSRVAKNFQDYFISVITQRLGARLYSDGIQHSLELPYSVFEDQRSGETQFSPFVSLVNDIQYDSQSAVLGWQGRFRWILTPGNDLYVVYTHNWLDQPLLDRFATLDRRLASKILYTYRF